jgi:hypothetical protein
MIDEKKITDPTQEPATEEEDLDLESGLNRSIIPQKKQNIKPEDIFEK